MWQKITDAEIISLTLCFSLIMVFKFMAATVTGGISTVNFDEVETPISLGQSTTTSNLHQLTCEEHKELVKEEIQIVKIRLR